MKRWIKRIFGLMLLGAFVAAIVYSFMPRPVAVDVAQVSEGELQVYVEEDGRTRLRDRYKVSAPLAGRLLRIRYKAGDVVSASQPLAVIEPADPALLDPRTLAQIEGRVKSAQADLNRTGAALEAARAALDHAELEHERAIQLHKKNSLSKSDLDLRAMQHRTKAEEHRAARHAEEWARSELEVAKAALLRTLPREPGADENVRFEVPAPPLHNSGRVFRVFRVFQESEVVVTPGTPLLELGDLSDLEVEIDVLSSDAVKIQPGARVLLEQWGGDKPLTARVRLVEPSGFMKISALGVEEQRVFVIADFPSREDVPSNLGDGYRVEAKIIIWEKDDVIRVPTSALFRHGEGWGVFRIEEGRAALCKVTIGNRNGLLAEVLEGLSPGDSVVVHPGDKVVNRVQVAPR